MYYGLIGENLSRSLSKIIHEKIASCTYDLHELKPEELDAFMRKADYQGINVASPFNRSVIPYLDEISEPARIAGSVDTIVNRDGKLFGYNTDYCGIRNLLFRNGTDPAGRKVLILGAGETGQTAFAAVSALGASGVYTVDHTGCTGCIGKENAITYKEACEKHSDAEIIINTTSCGMYPAVDDCPIDPGCFPNLCGLIDTICDPLRTTLVLKAQKRGIPAQGGLYMQVVKAACASELFTGRKIDSNITEQVYREVLNTRRNIVLTGMSLAGKTTLGTLLSQRLGRKLEDTDEMIIRTEQRPIPEIFSKDGEPYFRDVESAMVHQLVSENGIVIATGGGVILREENVDALKKNGFIVFLDRPLDQILPAEDRPLANTKEKVIALFTKRYPIYRSTCDDFIPNNISPEDGAEKILSVLQI